MYFPAPRISEFPLNPPLVVALAFGWFVQCCMHFPTIGGEIKQLVRGAVRSGRQSRVLTTRAGVACVMVGIFLRGLVSNVYYPLYGDNPPPRLSSGENLGKTLRDFPCYLAQFQAPLSRFLRLVCIQ